MSYKDGGSDPMKWKDSNVIRTYFEPLMEKVLLKEKYYIKNYFDFIIFKSDIEFIWNDHNPENNFWVSFLRLRHIL